MLKQSLEQKVREFAAFLSGGEGRFVFSYVKCFKQAQIYGVVFQYNGLDFNTFVVFVLVCGHVFLYGGVFTIEMFVDETGSAPDVALIAIVTGDLVNGVPQKAQFGFGFGAVVPGAYTLCGVVRESSSQGV